MQSHQPVPTSVTTDNAGAVASQARHYPYGQVRWSSGTSITDFGFTSQRNEASFGLMDYNARCYSPHQLTTRGLLPTVR